VVRSNKARLPVREGVIDMPIIRVNGAALYYEEHGTGLKPSSLRMACCGVVACSMQRLALLKERYRCVAFDFRGQGRSEVTRSGYDMETLYEDAVALMEQLGCAPCHFLGLSITDSRGR
jgi:3-oxoadipate enol-lactonase